MAKKNNRRDMASDITSAVREVTKKWKKTRKAEERSPRERAYRAKRMTGERGVSQKEAAAQIMEEAYLKASGNGLYPANARQIMYAARGYIQNLSEMPLESNYFTQTILPNYIDENNVDWDVVYDARGHFSEPHSKHNFGIGTIDVREYLVGFHDPRLIEARINSATVETKGPNGNFGAVLFIEKEGFAPLFEAAHLAERYDIAIMSTKGMSVTAARALVDEMCSVKDIPLLLLHDFDKAGFSIAGTLQRDTRRYEFKNNINVVDLGLSLADVEEMGLEHEDQYLKGQRHTLEENLRANGAGEEEIAFMFQDFDTTNSVRRVELNAMTSPQFVAYVERKLQEHGVTKIVPSQDLLAEVYAGMERGRRLEEVVDNLDEDDIADFKVPDDLEKLVRKVIEAHPTKRWDAALAMVLDDNTVP